MTNRHDDHKIIEKLQQLPKIKDSTDKEVLYNQILMRMNRSAYRKSANKSTFSRTFIPLFSAALVVVILLIMLPSFINQPMLQTSDKGIHESANTSEELFEHKENDALIEMAEVDEEEQEKEVKIHSSYGEHFTDDTFVLNQIPENTMVVYKALVEEQLQYVIPLSFVVPKTASISEAYNNFQYDLKEEWDVMKTLFDHITYDIDLDNHEVTLIFEEPFSVGDGSTRGYIFQEMLGTIFQPLGIKKVSFLSRDGQDFDLGSIGNITEMELPEPVASVYKLFDHPDATRQYFVPIKKYDEPIETALNDMKENEEFFHVYQTIPSDVYFNVESLEDELTVHFTDETILKDDQTFVMMIEAILMTAKSYQYGFVKFENFNIEQIGPYDITLPLEVPEIVNPIGIVE